MEFNFTIKNDKLTSVAYPKGVTGNVNTYICRFDIECDISDLIWFCIFKQGDNVYNQIIEDNACIMPYEVLTSVEPVYIGCYGTNANDDIKRVSTNLICFDVKQGAYSEGIIPDVPTADAWEIYVNSKVEPLLEEIETAESQRQTAENNRLSAENNRNIAESNRKTAEDDRATAESERATAETQRLNAEANRKSNETDRILAETARVEAESARADAEAQRALSESERQSAETERVMAELGRAEAETARVSAENARVEAEAARAEELAKKADKATTLEGYGITDAYTKTEVDTKDSALKDDISDLKQKSIPHTTASGYPLTVTDHLEGETVINYQVYGNSVQDGTPTPETPIEIQSVGNLVTDETSEYYGKYDVPVTVCGKNILPYPYTDTTRTLYGITFTDNKDGTITLNGTSTFSTTTSIADVYLCKTMSISAGTYTLSGCPSGGSTYKYRLMISIKKSGGTSAYSSDVGQGYSFTVDTDATVTLTIRIGGEIGTVSNLVFKPQLEKGSTATSYEPYTYETKHIYLDEPLRKVGNYADYVDFQSQKTIRQVEVLDDTGTTTIAESFGILATPTEESIIVPELTAPNSAVMNISSGTAIQPSQIDLTYYQDINKVITNLTNAILAQGGNV